MLTQARLREVLSYDPETGQFVWRVAVSNRASAGTVAGWYDAFGYIKISLDGGRYHAGRLAWFYVHGTWPAAQIDHINCVRDDNRLCNLREATSQQNQANRKTDPRNKSGFKGVYLHATGRWAACICRDYRKEHLGIFDTPAEANAAYLKRARELFGEYARSA